GRGDRGMTRKARKCAANAASRRGGRPVWKGGLKFGLVSIPVKALPARARDGADVELHWLHASCHSRIHYKKVCPIHGEVPDDEIVSSYQTGRKSYVVIEPEEVARLRRRSEDTLDVTHAVTPKTIDPMYYTVRSYFGFPTAKAASRPTEYCGKPSKNKSVSALPRWFCSARNSWLRCALRITCSS